jgi:hypothetical protein
MWLHHSRRGLLVLEKDIQSIGRLTHQKIADATDALRLEIAQQGDQVEKQCLDIIGRLEKETGELDRVFSERLKSELEHQKAIHKVEIDSIRERLIEKDSLDELGATFEDRLKAEVEKQQSIHRQEVESITQRLAEEKALVIESIEAINEQLEQRIDLEQKLVERIETIKDGEQGEQGEKGERGTDGLDRPVLEPVHLKANNNYPKNTLGLYKGGLWISTKDALGYPQDDPHAWHCILDAMNTLSVDLQEDRTFKLSVETSAGNVIESNFHIPFPQHKGIWEEGEYSKGDIVTKGHSMFHCIEDTSGQPPGNGWQQILTAQRGRDGKSIVGPQGVPGRNGLDAKLPDNFIEEVLELASQNKAFEDGRSGAEAITSFRGYFLSGEAYNRGDVVNLDGGLYVCTSSGQFDSIAKSQDSWELMLVVPKVSSPAYMLWKGEWIQGNTYNGGHVVRDGNWLMVALTQTTDKAAPQAIGPEFNLYTGSDPTTSQLAKQITQGARYTSTVPVWINGYRLYTIAGNFYRVFSVSSTGQVTELLSFTANTTGWSDFPFGPQPLAEGAEFTLVTVVQEPDPTPTTWTSDWNYTTPNNLGIPGAGVVIHANDDTSSLRINKTSSIGDESANLEALTIGDIIDSGNISWAIQNITDNGTWMNFSVAPAVQDSPDGVRTFTFETVTSTPITYLSDPDYYLSSPSVQGMLGVDIGFEDIVPDDNAYGVDLIVQNASISPDWDLMAYSGLAGAGGGGSQNVISENVLLSENFTDQNPTGLGVAYQVLFGGVDSTAFWSMDAAGAATCLIADEYTIRLRTVVGREGATGVSQVYQRALINGVQYGNSSQVIIDDSRIEIPLFYNVTISFDVGDVLTFEIIRDTDGDDSGGLRAGVPDVVGWNPGPSCSLSITRTYLG